MEQWQDNGESLIIAGDWNRNIYDNQLKQEFEQRGLYPAITSSHKETAPETYCDGSYPIDEIYVTQDLQVTSSGYLEHGQNKGDHRPIWVELDKEDVIGTIPPPLLKHNVR